jgi:serine/threonine protein kinase
MPELKLQQSRLDGRYDIIECLGRGSYAEIYVARDNAASEGNPANVVIKALNVSLQGTPDTDLEKTLVTNFQNEAIALDRVRHPNIISRLGHGTAIDLAGVEFHYLVLEHLSGGDMSALTRNNPLTLEKTFFYLQQVCAGLAYAHQCGVIHRDIKPQNLLLIANRQIVKIADFGVARFDNSEGEISRVGTNIYAAPEHNPMLQTGTLDNEFIPSSKGHLTAAADIYSLAKTAYTLLAGHSPRRFAQHAITEMPDSLRELGWGHSVLRVLEKATQLRPENRYQSVEEFWDELAVAVLPPTQPLNRAAVFTKKPSADFVVPTGELTEAPPRPKFEEKRQDIPASSLSDYSRRPQIVVAVKKQDLQPAVPTRTAKEIVAAFPDRAVKKKSFPRRQATFTNSRSRRIGVALALVLGFAGMLLATHKYVTSHWNPLADIPAIGDMFVVGREGVTTTDVNLRPAASAANQPIGLAENGSRVKVINANDNWYEVQVLAHGRPKIDPFTSDRGWINRKFVRFD